MNSEFGRGFTYCIGLFLCHAERQTHSKDESLWFNGAADYLFELEIPEDFTLKNECRKWQQKCIEWRDVLFKENPPKAKDKRWALEKAKDFLLAWDKQCKIKSIRGDWR